MTFKEDQHIELKENPKSGTIVNEIVAFLNTCDGTIYVGVKDNGTIAGIDKTDDALLMISNIIADQIEPSPRDLVSTDTISFDGKDIIKISVKKGKRLYYVKKYGMSSSGCFERIGTSARGMTPEQISKRYIESLTIPERKMVDVSCNRTDLTFTKFKTYLAARNIHFNESKFEENFNLMTPDGKYNLIADLLADENMDSIKVAIFKGNDKSEYLKRNEYGFTCLLYAMDQVSEYCLALNETYVDTSTIVRKEKKMFDEDAFREAWINAVVHNKWVDGIPPAIYWFEDRLEIISYGTIPSGMTKDDFLSGKTHPVNEELMKIFLQCHIVEQTGHGVPKVVSKYGIDAYDFGTSTITVTIPFEKKGFDKQNAPVNAPVKLSASEKEILELIASNPSITTDELAKSILKNRTTITRSLRRLKDKGIIERIGSDKNGQWKIKK